MTRGFCYISNILPHITWHMGKNHSPTIYPCPSALQQIVRWIGSSWYEVVALLTVRCLWGEICPGAPASCCSVAKAAVLHCSEGKGFRWGAESPPSSAVCSAGHALVVSGLPVHMAGLCQLLSLGSCPPGCSLSMNSPGSSGWIPSPPANQLHQAAWMKTLHSVGSRPWRNAVHCFSKLGLAVINSTSASTYLERPWRNQKW